MPELIARIGPSNTVELTLDGAVQIAGIEPLTPEDALYLARGLIACALAANSGDAKIGAIFADAHIPIREWVVGTSHLSQTPSLQLTSPSGLQMTFVLPETGCEELGVALISRGLNRLDHEQARGTVH